VEMIKESIKYLFPTVIYDQLQAFYVNMPFSLALGPST